MTHSKEFKSEDGVCTYTIEGLWGLVKAAFAWYCSNQLELKGLQIFKMNPIFNILNNLVETVCI